MDSLFFEYFEGLVIKLYVLYNNLKGGHSLIHTDDAVKSYLSNKLLLKNVRQHWRGLNNFGQFMEYSEFFNCHSYIEIICRKFCCGIRCCGCKKSRYVHVISLVRKINYVIYKRPILTFAFNVLRLMPNGWENRDFEINKSSDDDLIVKTIYEEQADELYNESNTSKISYYHVIIFS